MINFLNEVDDVEAEGADDDHPIDDDEMEGGDDGKDPDSEPSLGAGDGVNQERAWSLRQNPTTDDREEQNEDGSDDDREVSELEITLDLDQQRAARHAKPLSGPSKISTAKFTSWRGVMCRSAGL